MKNEETVAPRCYKYGPLLAAGPTIVLERGIFSYVEVLFKDLRKLLKRNLRADQDGVVSFEYLIVAACIIAVVSLAFGAGGPLGTAINAAITAISTALTTAVAAG